VSLHPCYRIDEHSSHDWWERETNRWQRCPGHTTTVVSELEDLTDMRRRNRLHIRDATIAVAALSTLVLYSLWSDIGYVARVVLIALAVFSVWATVRL
jgi:hypothetical protein